jgi:hypothetical protein
MLDPNTGTPMNNSSLMSRTAATGPSANNGKLLSQLRDALAPSVSSLSLEERLEKLTPEQRQHVLTFAQLARTMAATEIALKGYSTESYLDVVRKVYRGGNLMMQQLIADVLEEVAPIEVIKAEPKPKTDARMSFYMRDDFKLPNAIKDDTEAPKPEPEQLSFLDLLEQSESSGRSDAEITIGDGRRFVGSLQFGEARLSDHQKATGTRFTQDEFIADEALQDAVAAWHIAEIDDAITALGDAAVGYDRDGLRAVAHLGGVGGMKQFVRTKGEYNPADELGTSLKSYYDKFSAS